MLDSSHVMQTEQIHLSVIASKSLSHSGEKRLILVVFVPYTLPLLFPVIPWNYASPITFKGSAFSLRVSNILNQASEWNNPNKEALI